MAFIFASMSGGIIAAMSMVLETLHSSGPAMSGECCAAARQQQARAQKNYPLAHQATDHCVLSL